MRGSWRPNRTATYWPPLLWPSALCLSRSPGLLNQMPSFLLGAGFLTTSCLQTLRSPNSSIEGPEGPFCRVLAFSTTFYLQLSDLHTAQLGVPRTPSAGCWLTLPLTDFLSSPSYIIVQSPTQYLPITGHRNMHFRRLLNGMFYRHQAEITVMQFTGHFLLVH